MRALRIAVLFVVTIGVAVALATRPPIPQPPEYHAFADTHAHFGIANAWNVLSNIPFALVGILGLGFVFRGPKRGVDPEPRAGAHTAFVSYRERPAYVLFFTGVFLTAFGSSYYHLAPSTERLFWDRLPMAIAFMSLFAAMIAERIDVYWSRILLLPLVALGVVSVVMWRLSEARGAGDLRLYVFVQGFPMLALPLMMALFRARYTRSWEILVVVLFYGGAKVLEHFDVQVWDALGQVASGHSLKHLAAAAATYAVLDMLKHRSPAPLTEDALAEPAVE